MPFTEKQRKFFHAQSGKKNPDGMSQEEARKLADEADRLTKEGKERKPVKKADNFIDLSRIWNNDR